MLICWRGVARISLLMVGLTSLIVPEPPISYLLHMLVLICTYYYYYYYSYSFQTGVPAADGWDSGLFEGLERLRKWVW